MFNTSKLDNTRARVKSNVIVIGNFINFYHSTHLLKELL